MSGKASFGRTLAVALSPLRAALSDPARLTRLLRQLGWAAELSADDFPVLQALIPVATELQDLAQLVEQLDAAGDDATGALLGQIAELALSVIAALESLSELETSDLTALPAPLDDPETWGKIALALPSYLLVHHLRWRHRLVYALGVLVGVIREEYVDRALQRRLDFSAIGDLFTDPASHFSALYDWPQDLDHRSLMLNLAKVASAAGVPARYAPVRSHLATQLLGLDPEDEVTTAELSVSLLRRGVGGAWLDLGLLLMPVPDPIGDATSEAYGLMLSTLLFGSASAEVSLSDVWSLELGGELDASGLLGVAALPSGIAVPAAAPDATATVELVGRPAVPWQVLGTPGGPGLTVAGLRLGLELRTHGVDPEVIAIARFESPDPAGGLRMSFAAEDGDAFLQEQTGGASGFGSNVGFRWSSRDGFSLDGVPELAIDLPVQHDLGAIRVDTVSLALSSADSGSVRLEGGATGALELGPFSATVDRLGLIVEAIARQDGSQTGAFGPLDIDLTFLPPLGIGLDIESKIASGGGYLFLDHEAGEYAGVVDLDIKGVGLTAIGMIATQLPDGAAGWSMFLSLAARLKGVQLGFGFTLDGVGGVIGIHRGLDEQALADGVRSGALDSLLFPDDPVDDAPRILNDLGAVFPPAPGQFVFGPIAKLGWGSPTLAEIDLGVILQLPEPLTVSLLGSLEALLPSKEKPAVELRVDVAGTLNFTEGTVKIDAALRDSRIKALELTGSLAVRASMRDDPTFLLAVGGFHPDFAPPADFPALERLGVSLDTGDNLRISLGGYFALTSNTVQFGAELAIWARAVGVTAEGGASFDALVQFRPFGFIIGLEVWVSIRAAGVDLLGVQLLGELSGPNRWHVVGVASFKVLGVQKSFELEASFGQADGEAPGEAVDVASLLIEELGREDAWVAVPPTGDGDPVVLQGAASDTREVHPAGQIELRQRVVPLNTRIEQYGNAPLAGGDLFELAAPRLGPMAISEDGVEPVVDWFAAAQYFELSDDEKLAAPSFEKMTAGVRLGGSELAGGPVAALTVDHESVYRDPKVRPVEREHSGGGHVATQEAVHQALAFGASLTARTAADLPRSPRQVSAFAVSQPSYVVNDADTGLPAPETAVGPVASYYAARQASLADSRVTGRVILPTYEREHFE